MIQSLSLRRHGGLAEPEDLELEHEEVVAMAVLVLRTPRRREQIRLLEALIRGALDQSLRNPPEGARELQI